MILIIHQTLNNFINNKNQRKTKLLKLQLLLHVSSRSYTKNNLLAEQHTQNQQYWLGVKSGLQARLTWSLVDDKGVGDKGSERHGWGVNSLYCRCGLVALVICWGRMLTGWDCGLYRVWIYWISNKDIKCICTNFLSIILMKLLSFKSYVNMINFLLN